MFTLSIRLRLTSHFRLHFFPDCSDSLLMLYLELSPQGVNLSLDHLFRHNLLAKLTVVDLKEGGTPFVKTWSKQQKLTWTLFCLIRNPQKDRTYSTCFFEHFIQLGNFFCIVEAKLHFELENQAFCFAVWRAEQVGGFSENLSFATCQEF